MSAESVAVFGSQRSKSLEYSKYRQSVSSFSRKPGTGIVWVVGTSRQAFGIPPDREFPLGTLLTDDLASAERYVGLDEDLFAGTVVLIRTDSLSTLCQRTAEQSLK